MCCPPARRWRTTARSLTSDLFRSGSRHRCWAAALPLWESFSFLCRRAAENSSFSWKKRAVFQHFPRTFQHPSRKTPKRNVEKQVFCLEKPVENTGERWKIHFCGENLLNSTAFSRFFSEPPQSDKRSVLYDQKAKKEPAADPDRAGPCDPAQAAASVCCRHFPPRWSCCSTSSRTLWVGKDVLRKAIKASRTASPLTSAS